jgi:hypothetical protein
MVEQLSTPGVATGYLSAVLLLLSCALWSYCIKKADEKINRARSSEGATIHKFPI